MDYFDVVKLKERVSIFITEYYGERCPDYEPECICCEQWMCFDKLFRDLLFLYKDS